MTALALKISDALPGMRPPMLPHDPADRLPPEAQNKLRRLKQLAADANAMMMPVSDQLQELRTSLHADKAQLRQLIDPRWGGGNRIPDDDHPEVLKLRDRIERGEAEVKRLQEIYNERRATWDARAGLVRNLENFVKQMGQVVALNCEAATPKRGEILIDSVERIRREIEAKRVELDKVRNAPLPAAIAKNEIRKFVDSLRGQYMPDARRLLQRSDDRAEFLHSLLMPPVNNVGAAAVPAVVPLFAWLHGDEWIARLEAEIDAVADDGAALTDEQRKKREQTLRAELLQLEFDEESFIEKIGDHFMRRPDCDPRAVLRVMA